MARRGLDAAALVAAGAAVADAEGLDAVTVARVAADVGIRGPSLYNHVAGRDGLVRGIALAGLAELAGVLRDAAVGRSGSDALIAVAHAYRAWAREHPGRYEAIQRAPAAGDDELAAAGRAGVDVLAGLLRGWHLEGDEAVHAVRGLRSTLHGFVDLERVGGFALPASLDTSYTRIVETLVAGLDARAAGPQGSTTSTA